MEPRFPVGEDTLWFVFQEDNQSGPFVTSELASRMNAGEISEESFVWAQGFSDWTPASEIPGLAAYRLDLKSFEQAEAMDKVHDSLALRHTEFVGTQSDEKASVEDWVARQAVVNEKLAKVESILDRAASHEAKQAEEEASPFVRHKYKIAVGLSAFIFAAGSFAMQSHKQDPIGTLSLSASDRSALRNAISQSHLFSGPSADVVVASANGENPRFAIGTNLADSSKLEIRIDGVPGKMLDRSRYAMKAVLLPKNGFLLTDRLAEVDGKPFRAGLYRVTVKDSQRDSILSTKTFFLGAVPGGDFEAALALYQADLKEQAQMETMELRQLLETTSKILIDSSKWFAKSESKTTLATQWRERFQQFGVIDAQLKSLEQQWSTEPMASQIVNIEAYRKMAEMIQQVRAGHTAIENFVNTSDPMSRAANRELIAQSWLKAQSASENLTKLLEGTNQ